MWTQRSSWLHRRPPSLVFHPYLICEAYHSLPLPVALNWFILCWAHSSLQMKSNVKQSDHSPTPTQVSASPSLFFRGRSGCSGGHVSRCRIDSGGGAFPAAVRGTLPDWRDHWRVGARTPRSPRSHAGRPHTGLPQVRPVFHTSFISSSASCRVWRRWGVIGDLHFS